MDLKQFKLLAGRVRGLLEQSDLSLNHSQALDLSAALLGLRNWPEVTAFQDRLDAFTLDLAATQRLAFRIEKRHGLTLTAGSLLDALSPPGATSAPERAPQIWPAGPRPGVYVTTSQAAINALLAAYEEATDGAVVYAERAGSSFDGSIDLGDYGLWSTGLSRVPSGTLIVIGPVELNQQSGEDNAIRLEAACRQAQAYQHRVAVLVQTPAPDCMHLDLHLLVKGVQPDGDDMRKAFAGVVTEEGELELRTPFVHTVPTPVHLAPAVASMHDVPPEALSILKGALSVRHHGLLLVGSDARNGHDYATDLVTAMLTLTEGAGPAARILARHRSTPAKDYMVPDALKALPMLTSIESAYALGYRRMVVQPGYTEIGQLLEYGEEVCFIGGGFGMQVSRVFDGLIRNAPDSSLLAILEKTIAVLGVGHVQTAGGPKLVADLYVPNDVAPPEKLTLIDDDGFLMANRTLRWEDRIEELLGSWSVGAEEVQASFKRNAEVLDFLQKRKRRMLTAG